jgi:hypothetical protein
MKFLLEKLLRPCRGIGEAFISGSGTSCELLQGGTRLADILAARAGIILRIPAVAKTRIGQSLLALLANGKIVLHADITSKIGRLQARKGACVTISTGAICGV